MKPISTAAKEMPRSGIRVILDLAVRIPDAIHLEIGQPDFPTPPHIVEAAHQAMLQGFTKYTPNSGLLSLREAIAHKVTHDNAIPVTSDHIVVTTGGMGGLFSSAAAVLDPGDEVLVPDPGYPNYGMMAMLCRANAVRYPLTGIAQGFQPILDALPGLVTPRTKAIVLNSPSTPTGSVIPPQTLAALVEFARRHDLYVISDECYEKIVFDASHISAGTFDTDGRVLSVFSFSKTYSMTGWRVGYVATTPDLAMIITKLQEATVACASSVSQKAAEAALAGPQDSIPVMVDAYRRRRDAVLDILKSRGLPTYTPQGAFYLLIDISRCQIEGAEELRSERFARDFLTTEHVAVAPGRTFGYLGNRYIRISLAASEETLTEGVGRLCRFIESKM
jgi:aspartate aminotransferase